MICGYLWIDRAEHVFPRNDELAPGISQLSDSALIYNPDIVGAIYTYCGNIGDAAIGKS